MKKALILLVAVAMVAIAVLGGCRPGTPDEPEVVMPEEPAEYKALQEAGLVKEGLPLNPYAGGLATKPDGTPYTIGHTWLLFDNDIVVNFKGYMTSLVTRAGGTYVAHDAEAKVDQQMGWLDDQATAQRLDAVLIHAVEEKMVLPAAEALQESGIPVLSWDTLIPSDKLFGRFGADSTSQWGEIPLGEFLYDYVEETGKELNVLTPWSIYANDEVHARHEGFETGIANHPLINLIDPEIETWCSDAPAQEYIMTWFNMHPELNALYLDCAGGNGAIEGLKALGMIHPPDDPNHIVMAFHVLDHNLIQYVRDGTIDIATNHPGPALGDVGIKILLNYLVLGEEMPAYSIRMPIQPITAENIDTVQNFGCTALYELLPPGKWDLWPVLDTTEPGLFTDGPEYAPVTIPTPTVEKRKAQMGY